MLYTDSDNDFSFSRGTVPVASTAVQA